MKNIRCFFGFHKFSKWKEVGKSKKNKYQEVLKRKCKICGKLEFYDGLVQTCIVSGEKTPYIFKD